MYGAGFLDQFNSGIKWANQMLPPIAILWVFKT